MDVAGVVKRTYRDFVGLNRPNGIDASSLDVVRATNGGWRRRYFVLAVHVPFAAIFARHVHRPQLATAETIDYRLQQFERVRRMFRHMVQCVLAHIGNSKCHAERGFRLACDARDFAHNMNTSRMVTYEKLVGNTSITCTAECEAGCWRMYL